MSKKNRSELTITKTFKTPINLVFKAFSDADCLIQWWGSKEYPVKIVKFEFLPDGIFHYKMEGENGVVWGLFTYKQIQAPNKLEYIVSFSDENEKITRAPFSELWPLEICNNISLTEQDGTTTLVLKAYPTNANEEENALFKTAHNSVKQGFLGTFNQLEEFLNRIN